MSKSALELIPGELQGVRLRFEDEPALYLACLRDEADDR